MAILLEIETLPQQGSVALKLEYNFEIKITARQAQRLVDRWLLNQVSYLMGAGEPLLVVSQEVMWRVPVYLGTSNLGQLGPIGMIEVSIRDGRMATTSDRKAEIICQAEKLVKSFPPYHPRQPASLDYLASDISPAPELVVNEAGEIVPNSEKVSQKG